MTPQLPPPSNGDGEKRTWIALDGVDPNDFAGEGQERLQQRILEYLLLETSVPVTDVRIIDNNN